MTMKKALIFFFVLCSSVVSYGIVMPPIVNINVQDSVGNELPSGICVKAGSTVYVAVIAMEYMVDHYMPSTNPITILPFGAMGSGSGGVFGGSYTLQEGTHDIQGVLVIGGQGATSNVVTLKAYPAVSITGLGNGVLSPSKPSISLGASKTAASYAWTKEASAAGTASTLDVTTAATYGLSVTYASGCVSTAPTVTTTLTTGLKEQSALMQVYSSDSYIFVKGNVGATMLVADVMGNLLYDGILICENETLPLSFKKGMYVVNVNGSATKVLIR